MNSIESIMEAVADANDQIVRYHEVNSIEQSLASRVASITARRGVPHNRHRRHPRIRNELGRKAGQRDRQQVAKAMAILSRRHPGRYTAVDEVAAE